MNLVVAAGSFSVLTPIAMLFGRIMDLLFQLTSRFGIYDLGLCIILFTIITKILLFPLTVKQQESTKLMSLMNPEIQAIQKKYKGKTDQTSLTRQQMEMQAVYEKYGSSPTAGCLPLLIQLPILFSLYRIIYDIPKYVPSVGNIFRTVATPLMAEAGFAEKTAELATAAKVANYDAGNIESVMNFLYKLTQGGWESLKNLFPAVFANADVSAAMTKIEDMNTFLGINLASAPWQGFTGITAAWIIPILAGLTQFASTKLMSGAQKQDPDAPGAQMMNQMTYTMPLLSVFMCFTLPTAIGIYWVMQGALTMVQQLIVNKRMDSVDVNDLIARNVEKMNRKRAKKGLPPAKISSNANASLKSIQAQAEEEAKEEQEKGIRQAANRKVIQESKEYYNADAKPGSIASKAAMVKRYNERQENK